MAERRKQRTPAGGDDSEPDFSDERVRRRWINNLFGYWRVCGEKTCRRGRGCTGDPLACFKRWWPVTPERPKVEFRALIKARRQGMTPQDALRHADAEVERAAEHIARVDAETEARMRALDEAASNEGQRAAQDEDATPLPRVRTL